ncbi:MAG TPA: deoxyhypusine synthase family protein [Planctomycetota bacterium]|nr:deoxyhypusine synthase family protein [Planctomycetota bacterium]HRR80216.1 deoxyhypusine synthase family protein [Planctomycetota bacterium]HRT93136.1 deoxyhypusine synthase family protein [Planctomycetota bacterium]
MEREKLHDGRSDGLEPLEPLDVRSTRTFVEMLEAMSKTAFGGRNLGEAFHVLKAMSEDPDCTIVLTISGAMTVAKMGKVVCEMINAGLAHIVISTGALMAHGLTEAIGLTHYKHNPAMTDKELYEKGYNRVYDTLEMEENLCQAERVMSAVLGKFDWSRPTCSSEVTREVGRHLFEHGQMPSILGCAYAKGVPVYVPAFTDSELGLDLATHILGKAVGGPLLARDDPDAFFGRVPNFNPYLDLHDYAKRALRAKRLGIFTVGGGVPRNWAQQVAPFVEIINMRVGTTLAVPRFQYGVRVCPEPVHWGGLSGCTYSEGVSWGKFVSPDEGGRYAEVYCDATIAWPLLVRAVCEARGLL